MSQGHSGISTRVARESEPSLSALLSEQRYPKPKPRTLDAEDAAFGVIRDRLFGPKLRVCWSLNEAMKA